MPRYVLVGVDVGTRVVEQLMAGERKTGDIVLVPYLKLAFFVVIPGLSCGVV